MTRVAILGFLVAAVCLTAFARSGKAPAQIEELREQRLALLQERVDSLRRQAEMGLISPEHMHRATIDLQEARLEYADSLEDRRQVLTELLTAFDALVDVKQQQVDAGSVSSRTAYADLLLLKADRVKFQIMQAELE